MGCGLSIKRKKTSETLQEGSINIKEESKTYKQLIPRKVSAKRYKSSLKTILEVRSFLEASD